MMRRPHLLGTSSFTAMALAATTATADVTSADVWASYVSFYEATGAQVIGEPAADGADTLIADPALLYRLPFGIATIRFGLPDLRMTEQSDGTVTISYPETFDLRIEVDVPDEGSGSGVFSVTQAGYAATASGDPGAVTFAQSADSMRIEAKELNIPDLDLDFQMQILSQGYAVSSTVIEGELINVTSESDLAAMDVAYVFSSPTGEVVSNTGQIGRTVSSSEMALPAGGSNLFDLSRALQDGAFLRTTSSTASNISETITTIEGEVFSEQSSNAGPTDVSLSIDTAGLDISAVAAATSFKALIPELFPLPIEGSIAQTKAAYQFPLLPSEEPQDFGFVLGLSELVVSDNLWSLLDPTGEMPRDPANLNIDIQGTVLSEIDWLNFATLEAQMDQPIPPISPESVTINDLSVSAVGAAAQASGSFTLDMTDMETFDGFPRPEGNALLTVQGANGLIDRLTTLGLIGPDEAGMARLGMGFIARATGDDAFETAVEVTADGQVLVNGQRMR